MKEVNVGLIGLGTVGAGVVKILERSSAMKQRIGAEIKLKKICDKNPAAASEARGYSFTTDFEEILNDPEIDIVVELIGGMNPAKEITLKAIEKGKHVVTANKAVLAEHWNEIFTRAAKKKVLVYFEASVGAGIPIIQALNEGLVANEIKSVYGILNGTTNFILTKMTKENMDFDRALKEAQEKGFAEANPTLDIEGFDTAHKLAVLGSIIFGTQTGPEKVYKEGIRGISPQDVMYAKELGYVIKLLAILRQHDKGVELRVYPTLIPQSHPLSAVENEYNAIFVRGDVAGDMMFYGKGAGQMPAASAVVSDIIFVAQKVANGIGGIPYVFCDPGKKLKVQNPGETETRYYLRFMAEDKPGVLSKISGILGKHNVSIEQCYQKGTSPSASVPIVMTTHKARERDVQDAVKDISKLSVAKGGAVVLRIEDF